jgi:hypothetical protein
MSLESDESKASATASIFVTHYGNIDDFTELRKVIFNIDLFCWVEDASYEELDKLGLTCRVWVTVLRRSIEP